jgi:hypothetical protein
MRNSSHGDRRRRRRLVAGLRRAANSIPTRSRHTALLQDRVATVRHELLELALILEHSDDLDASWIFAIHRLLTDGCESPLYNREIHISELRATLYYLRNAHRLEPAPNA